MKHLPKKDKLINDSGITEKSYQHGDIIVIIACSILIAYLLYLGVSLLLY